MSTAAQPESVPSPSHPESDARRVEDTDVVPDAPIKDQWALQYIGVHLVRPLIEVIDEDVSSFVTIAEVNAFTASRPAEWRYDFTKLLIGDTLLNNIPVSLIGSRIGQLVSVTLHAIYSI